MTKEELYNKLRHVSIGGNICQFSMDKCESLLPMIHGINSLKKAKDAVVLAHSYVGPEIIYSVADFSGDSYGLSKDAMATDAKVIIFAAVCCGTTGEPGEKVENHAVQGRVRQLA